MPTGDAVAAAGRGVTTPNQCIALVSAGIVLLLGNVTLSTWLLSA